MSLRNLIFTLVAVIAISVVFETCDFGFTQNIEAAANSPKKNVRVNSKKKTRKKRKNKYATIKVVMNDTATGEWIHRGKKNIVIHKDTAGILRAMAPFSMTPAAGKEYANAINLYAEALKDNSVKVWSMVIPSQGEFYMPPQITDNLSQKEVIARVADMFNGEVVPIFVSDTLYNHREEDIYLHTDHHWSGLGAYYGASAVASCMETPFTPLSEYQNDTIRNFVGTMPRLSGDKEITKYPEDFVFHIPKGDYSALFTDYIKSKKKGFRANKPHEGNLFRKFQDGSSAAYSTYLGGDNHTVKITNHNGRNGKKLCIVKDSYGNALAPYLINSFDEVHVIDFRYYPKNLLKYIKDNGITDLIFVNSVELAFTATTAQKLNLLRRIK